MMAQLRETLNKGKFTHPANRLDSGVHCAYVAGGRYQSRPCGSPIVSTTTVNHKPLISLNTFPLGL